MSATLILIWLYIMAKAGLYFLPNLKVGVSYRTVLNKRLSFNPMLKHGAANKFRQGSAMINKNTR